MIEYNEEDDFESDHETKLNLDQDLLLSMIDVDKPLENRVPEIEAPIVPLNIPVNRHNCQMDKAYNPSTNGIEKDGTNDHSKFEMGHLVLYGCAQKNGIYQVRDLDIFKLEYIFDADPSDLPSEKGGDLRISDDDAKYVNGTDLQGQSTVGKGAYCIRIKYKNGSSASPIIKTNFMANKTVGSVVDILGNSGIDFSQVEEIQLTIVYELYYWANAFDHHTNWRSDYTFKFS